MWKTERDPIKILSKWLVAQKLADPASFDQHAGRSGSRNEKGRGVCDSGAISESRQSGTGCLCLKRLIAN